MSKKIKQFYGSVKNRAAVAGALALGVAGSANAAISTTEITAALTDAGAAVAVVGAAVLVVHVGIKVYKYIRGAM